MKGRSRFLKRFFWTVFFLGLSVCHVPLSQADETSLFTMSSVQPNVLLILDNSNSMDQDFYGNAISAWKTGSRSVEARRALIDIVNTYANQMRIGLMSYRLPSSSKYRLHETQYFAAYDPTSYCPNPPPECDSFCRTGDEALRSICYNACSAQNASFHTWYAFTGATGDEILNTYAVGTEQRNRYCNLAYPKTQRRPNPADPGRYIYAKVPGTLYSSSSYGNAFCYSAAYNGSESGSDSYSCYTSKTGTADTNTGYTSLWFSSSFVPTDEDIALGFKDFGRRLSWQYSGQTWFANSSPGGGQLHVACAENPTTNTQKNALLAKLATKESDEAGYMACTSTSNPNTCAYIVNAGLTPTAGTFQAATDYFKGSGTYTSPIQYWCQRNFIVYVTDGLPSVNESGTQGTATALMPTALQKIEGLRNITRSIGGSNYNFEIKTYVLGMGLTPEAKAQVDAMAVAGGTAIEGNAFYADNPTQLATELGKIISAIIENTYSFSSASVASTRTESENYLYEASFEPRNGSGYWPGHLKKYVICSDTDTNPNNNCPEGEVEGNLVGVDLNWCNGTGDVGICLRNRDYANRMVKTYQSGGFVTFSAADFTTPASVGAASDADRLATIGFVLGNPTYKADRLKLGDVFHSNPITIGKPSAFYSASGFDAFRTTVQNRTGIVVVGANDGQFHAFRMSDGEEAWSFMPPNMLPRLNALRTGTTHQYMVDGPTMVVDVNLAVPGWSTMLMFGLGRGGGSTLWSSSASCDSGFSPTYSAGTATNYCGYYVFDATNTSAMFDSPQPAEHPAVISGWTHPVIKPRAAEDAPYLGDPWSRITAGKVMLSGAEKWVGFFGGGFNGTDCSGGGACDTRGKGFFVIDLNDGNVIWSFTNGAAGENAAMVYSLPAHPGIADTDNDGYIDTAYIGDLGGNMWRFKFCTKAGIEDDTCTSTAHWTGGRFFDASGGGEGLRPVYNYPTVTKDKQNNLWVYWATGDKSDPAANSTNEKVLGVKDNTRDGHYHLADLRNATSQDCNAGDQGWRVNFTGREKALSDVTVFGGVVYFTTFIPPQGADVCGTSGESFLYAIDYRDCTGAFQTETGNTRMISLGAGMTSAPMISMKPSGSLPVDIFVTRSGGGGQGAGTIRVPFNPPTLSNKTNLLYWKDRRLQ
jgi:type IV pilus assembly protein PilY1